VTVTVIVLGVRIQRGQRHVCLLVISMCALNMLLIKANLLLSYILA